MAGDLCPYCGTLLTTSLKFCVNCRRSVTEDKIKHAGIHNRSSSNDDESGEAKFKLSRRSSYDSMRQMRSFFLTLSSLVGIFFVYYFTMKFVLHQPIPYEQEINQFVESMQNGGNTGSQGMQAVPQ